MKRHVWITWGVSLIRAMQVDGFIVLLNDNDEYDEYDEYDQY